MFFFSCLNSLCEELGIFSDILQGTVASLLRQKGGGEAEQRLCHTTWTEHYNGAWFELLLFNTHCIGFSRTTCAITSVHAVDHLAISKKFVCCQSPTSHKLYGTPKPNDRFHSIHDSRVFHRRCYASGHILYNHELCTLPNAIDKYNRLNGDTSKRHLFGNLSWAVRLHCFDHAAPQVAAAPFVFPHAMPETIALRIPWLFLLLFAWCAWLPCLFTTDHWRIALVTRYFWEWKKWKNAVIKHSNERKFYRNCVRSLDKYFLSSNKWYCCEYQNPRATMLWVLTPWITFVRFIVKKFMFISEHAAITISLCDVEFSSPRSHMRTTWIHCEAPINLIESDIHTTHALAIAFVLCILIPLCK